MAGIIEQIRKSWTESDDKRDEGLKTPEAILRWDNLSYGPDGSWQKLDIYRPRAAGTAGKADSLPVIVSVHGGAWVYGDKERYQYYCMDLAKRGFAVVNFTYRLCPEFQFPAPAEDIDLVFRFIRDHAGTYGLDTDRLFAVGDSAGAHLLGLYLCILADQDYAGSYPVELKRPLSVKAAALNCGIYDSKTAYRLDPNMQEIMQDFMPEGGSPEELDFISVLPHLQSTLPPLFIMTSTDDFLKYQAPILTKALCEKNVPFTFRLWTSEGRNDKLFHVFHLNIRSREAVRCNDEECAFFSSFCRP